VRRIATSGNTGGASIGGRRALHVRHTVKSGATYDVGILGWWYGKNYGSILTYYGLNRAIRSLGHSVLMVHEALGYNSYRVAWSDDILSMQFARRVGYEFTEQMDFSKLPLLNEQVGTFVVGSDQLWNPRIGRVNDDLFLDFVGPANRRVAYATSFGNRGTDKFKPEFVEKHAQNLGRFEAISVREAYAVKTARDVFGVEAVQTVDPVFLLPSSEYDSLAEQATVTVEGDYLAVFYLDPTPEKRRVAEAIADKLGLAKIVVIPNPDNGRQHAAELFAGSRFEILAEDSPENFLRTYRSARYVVTDSFHGTAFAVIFGKPFSSIYNTRRGADRFKSLMAALGFGETRRVFETDTPEKIGENHNVSFDVDFSSANRHIETERKASLRWLQAALAPQPEQPVRNGFLGVIRDRCRALMPFGARTHKGEGDLVDRPSFAANNAAWRITSRKSATDLRVAPGASVRGNLVWCDLPFTLAKGAAYRLTLDWAVRTTSRTVNLHVRNEDSGKFRVIGSVALNGRTGQRTDTVDFIVPEEGFSQFMLGAVHFTGDDAGAEVSRIAVKEIPVDAVKPSKKVTGHAEIALELALKDSERFVSTHAKSVSGDDVTRARARLMYHAHAIEKGLSRSDFRAGFGKIAVPGLAKEMNSWLGAGRSPQDQFFRIGVAVMHSYFRRHEALGVDVSEFRKLFSAQIRDLIAQSGDGQGGVVAAAEERESKINSNQNRPFLDIVYGRRSVREFTPEPVQDEDVARAVQIAMQAPSVCNRQGARVHQFVDPRKIKAALDLQGGFSGYKLPPRLLLVTCDLNAFLFAAERRQPFIDGGLFMMLLLLGLEQVGLGSCSLNTAMNAERESAIRKILGIPDNEVFISFVAVGHFDPAVMVPRSKRVPVDEILVRHDLARV
jgi:nitroreductase